MAREATATEPTTASHRTRHGLPDRETCSTVLSKMLLIRRFEERAGEMYGRAKIGGYLHLAIGEEASVVGATQALRDTDYLLSTYREHGQALARGMRPEQVMAELFGRVDGCSGGRGGSMHLFDSERRLLGGYGIVGANLPLAAGVALSSDMRGTDEVTLCMAGDGATNQGTWGETLNLAALWSLPVVFLIINNQFGMGTALERHSAITDLSQKGISFGVPGVQCDGMDVLDVHSRVSEALEKVRQDRTPQLIEAITYRFRGHSMADPELYRTKEEVEQWRERDPVEVFKARVVEEGVLSEEDVARLDEEAAERVDEAVRFADESDFPALDSLYDHLYVYGEQNGWYVFDERTPELHPGERERETSEDADELASAAAGYVEQQDAEALERRQSEGGAASDPEAEGGAD